MKKYWLVVLWSGLTMGMTGLLTYQVFGPDRRAVLPGPTSHGHYQIELDCNACHTPWMGVKEEACYDCHGAELKLANDSHPKSKFTDPRNADRLKLIRADNCVTCHREHVPEQTRPMGVTLPEDYCYQCHQQTVTDRPSHRDFAFNTCATAGCHNYHDNTALYENFLLRHAGEPPVKEPATRPGRQLLPQLIAAGRWQARHPLAAAAADAPANVAAGPELVADWAATAHARAGVNCTDCHLVGAAAAPTPKWSGTLDHTVCGTCHAEEVGGFLGGRHGMRLARGLTPMQPGMARLPMNPAAAHRDLTCTSCHGAHGFAASRAAVTACLECHQDDHSRAYPQSAHFRLWQAELAGDGVPGSGVSCATCHLPREVEERGGNRTVRVQHNQNLNLRPNEKMIRGVCLDCHGLGFSMDALADAALVRTNFIGRPQRQVESIDLALRRQMETRKPKTKPEIKP